MTARWRMLGLLPLFLVLALGCGKKLNPNAGSAIHGTVTYNGKPVTGGSLTIHTTGSNVTQHALSIGNDGTYGGAELPVGEVVITVETESINPAKKDKTNMNDYAQTGEGKGANMNPQSAYMDEMRKRGVIQSNPEEVEEAGIYVKIPSRYADVKKSPFHETLKKGDQKKDLELTD